MTTLRDTYPMAVYVIPRRGNQVLLSQRYNTGYGDGFYSFVAGHIDRGESVTETAIRESIEEAGIAIQEADLQFTHVLHRNSDDTLIYCDFFFIVEQWQGTPTVMEPHKCSELRWAAYDDLPENTLPYIRYVIQQIFVAETQFSEFGWR